MNRRHCMCLAILLLVVVLVPGPGESDDRKDKFSVEHGVPCRVLQHMLWSKKSLVGRLKQSINDTLTKPSGTLSKDEQQVQAEIIELFRRELDQFENGVFKSLNGLDRALAADYWSLQSVKANFKSRLEGLKAASLHEQENYDAISELEKKQEHAEQKHEKDVQRNISLHERHGSHRSQAEKLIKNLISGVVADVVAAADKLEDDLQKGQVFENSKQKEGAKLETVIKLEQDDDTHHAAAAAGKGGSAKNSSRSQKASSAGDKSGTSEKEKKKKKKKKEKDGGMSVLIDSKGNKYILAEPAMKVVTRHDWHFLRSLCLAIIVAFVLGLMCQQLNVPPFFGYVLSGVLIGPPGFNLVHSLVQVETLGEIGVYLLLFSIGLDFSVSQLREVWRVAVCGGGVTTAAMQLASLLAGQALTILPQQSCFVAACLTLSSTPLALRVLAQHNIRRPHKGVSPTPSFHSLKTRKERLLDNSDPGVDLGSIGSSLFGILLMQDIFLALFVALLPILAQEMESSQDIVAAQHSSAKGAQLTTAFPPMTTLSAFSGTDDSAEAIVPTPRLLQAIIILIIRTICLSLLCYVASIFLLPSAFRMLVSSGDKHDYGICLTLGSLSFVAACMVLTDYIGISMELGCLVAGMLVNYQGTNVTQQVLCSMEPVKHLFSAIFFVTIGFHVFPVFILHELVIIVVLTTAVVLVKFSVTYLVISSMVPAPQKGMVGVASTSVAQVSECAFLVGSRGRRLGLISREVYLLLLSITTASQLVAPVLWYSMSPWRSKPPLTRCLKAVSGLCSRVRALFRYAK